MVEWKLLIASRKQHKKTQNVKLYHFLAEFIDSIRDNWMVFHAAVHIVKKNVVFVRNLRFTSDEFLNWQLIFKILPRFGQNNNNLHISSQMYRLRFVYLIAMCDNMKNH